MQSNEERLATLEERINQMGKTLDEVRVDMKETRAIVSENSLTTKIGRWVLWLLSVVGRDAVAYQPAEYDESGAELTPEVKEVFPIEPMSETVTIDGQEVDNPLYIAAQEDLAAIDLELSKFDVEVLDLVALRAGTVFQG